LHGWGADYPDASNFLNPHFSVGATDMFGNPFSDIAGPLAQALTTADEQSRRPHYEAANNAIRQHIPMIPLSHGPWSLPEGMAVAFNRSVERAYASPFGFERFAPLSLPGNDTLVWMQSAEPLSLYCPDETDTESLRACEQITENLYRFQDDSAQVQPALAENCEPSPDLMTWTCTLRQEVNFHDGSLLDANDAAYSWIIQWDAAHPAHKGRTGEFAYFHALWGAFLNEPSQ
jgi:ABC-type transport system substrate-binding protein